MMQKLIPLMALLLLVSCGDDKNQEGNDTLNDQTDALIDQTQDAAELNRSVETIEYTVETIENGPNNWGYQILNNGQVFINQPHIPAVPGKNGFTSEEQAIRVGKLVITKLESGALPPTVTKQELDSLEIQYTNPF